jgi:hypothetical protein
MANWRVSEAAAMAFDHGDFGYGFNVINENGRPIVTFVYDENDDAKEAAAQVRAAVSKARVVQAHSQA